MAWPWVAAPLSGMAAGQYKKLNTNTVHDVALARTTANFGTWDGTWNDANVAAMVLTSSNSALFAFSSPAINLDTGGIRARGGGHTDGGDGSIFQWNPETSFAWSIRHKSGRIVNAAPTVTCNITAITAGTPPRLTVDADVIKTGDQVVVTSTTDANGTYHAVRIDATHVDLYNVDGTYNAQYTAFAGGSLTNSTGVATVTWNPQGSTSNWYYTTNADGAQMPPPMHTYHWKWIGNNRYLLSGAYPKDANAVPQNRIWILDEDATVEVYRSYHAPTGNSTSAGAMTHYGGAWGNGPHAYDATLGRVVGFSPVTHNWAYRVFEWESGQSTDSDFQRVRSLEDDQTYGATQGNDACTLPQPGATSNRALFAFYSTTQFNFCTDLGGTRTMSLNTFSDGAIFQTDMCDLVGIAVCWDDTNGELVYWGGGATIGAITVSSTLSAWTTAEITPATPTGDLPSRTGYPSNACCAIAKVPGYDAYLLARGSDVYLYSRSNQPSLITPSGIASAEAFGSSALSLTIAPSGIVSAEAFGNAVAVPGGVTITPSGIVSAEAFGVTVVSALISPTGIPSAEVFGTLSLLPGAVTVQPAGIASTEAFGASILLPGPVTIQPVSISSAEAFGVLQVSAIQIILPSGIVSEEQFGSAWILREFISGNLNVLKAIRGRDYVLKAQGRAVNIRIV